MPDLKPDELRKILLTAPRTKELFDSLPEDAAYFGVRDQRFRLIVNKRGSGCAKREFIGLCSRSLRNLMSEVIHGRARGYPHGA